MVKLTSEQQKVVDLILASIDPELHDFIKITNNSVQSTPIEISIRARTLPEETSSVFANLRKIVDEISPDNTLTDRVFNDTQSRSRRKSKSDIGNKVSKYAQLSVETGLNTDFDDIRLFKNLRANQLEVDQAARLVCHIWHIWNNSSEHLRNSRVINLNIVRGYFKQRLEYTHDELVNAVTNYGKWTDANKLIKKEGETIQGYWYYAWDLKKFLLSNNAMNHVATSWDQIVADKNIPNRFANKIEKVVDPQVAANNRKFYMLVAKAVYKGEDLGSWARDYKDNKEFIDEMVEELRVADAS